MRARVSIIALLMVLMLALACFPQNFPNPLGNPSTGVLGSPGTTWGGDHLSLEITADGANLNFDCASGAIAHPLSVDAQGKFRANGTLNRERPGPVMRDSPGAAQATYAGTIQGATMHLVVSSGGPEPYGEYVLTRGKPGRVLKCK